VISLVRHWKLVYWLWVLLRNINRVTRNRYLACSQERVLDLGNNKWHFFFEGFSH